MSPSPRFNKKKEYETNLHQYRVERELTVKDLERLADTNVNMIVGLANGSISPLDHDGHVKPPVQRILEVLDATIEEIFPKYTCKFGDCDAFTLDQVTEAFHNHRTPDQELDIQEFHKILQLELDPQEYAVILARFFDDASLRVVSDQLNISDEQVRHIQAVALRKLRKSTSQMRAFSYSTL